MRRRRIRISGLWLVGLAMIALAGAATAPASAFDDGPPPEEEHLGPKDGGHHDHEVWRERGRRGEDWGGGERRHRRGGRGGGYHDGPMTEQDVQELLEVLEDHRPELADRVREIGEKDPQRVREMLGRQGYRLRRLVMMKRYHPEVYELKTEDSQLWRRSDDLARRFRAVQDQDAQDALRGELQEVVVRHFEVRQKLREARLAKMRERLDQLQARVQARAEARQELIGERMADLTGDMDHAQW